MAGTDPNAGLELIRRFAADRSGATAVEYALIVGVISIGIAAALFSVREGMLNLPFGRIGNALTGN